MQDTRCALHTGGAMLASCNSLPCSLNAHKTDSLVPHERMEHAYGITAPTHTGHNHIRQLARPLLKLSTCFLTYFK